MSTVSASSAVRRHSEHRQMLQRGAAGLLGVMQAAPAAAAAAAAPTSLLFRLVCAHFSSSDLRSCGRGSSVAGFALKMSPDVDLQYQPLGEARRSVGKCRQGGPCMGRSCSSSQVSAPVAPAPSPLRPCRQCPAFAAPHRFKLSYTRKTLLCAHLCVLAANVHRQLAHPPHRQLRRLAEAADDALHNRWAEVLRGSELVSEGASKTPMEAATALWIKRVAQLASTPSASNYQFTCGCTPSSTNALHSFRNSAASRTTVVVPSPTCRTRC